MPKTPEARGRREATLAQRVHKAQTAATRRKWLTIGGGTAATLAVLAVGGYGLYNAGRNSAPIPAASTPEPSPTRSPTDEDIITRALPGIWPTIDESEVNWTKSTLSIPPSINPLLGTAMSISHNPYYMGASNLFHRIENDSENLSISLDSSLKNDQPFFVQLQVRAGRIHYDASINPILLSRQSNGIILATALVELMDMVNTLWEYQQTMRNLSVSERFTLGDAKSLADTAPSSLAVKMESYLFQRALTGQNPFGNNFREQAAKYIEYGRDPQNSNWIRYVQTIRGGFPTPTPVHPSSRTA